MADTNAKLEVVPCWFNNPYGLSHYRCLRMHVNETPHQPDSPLISFPVIHFPSQEKSISAQPVLHLGGGGPGAALHLDDDYSVFSLFEEMRALSVDQGRDLFLMDARGSGLSQPRLTCFEFTDNVVDRWSTNLALEDAYRDGRQDISRCIARYRDQGISFSAYSGNSVVHDIERLRVALGVERWVLYGVSYASIYAQMYATVHADKVDTMILDSATFIDIDHHEAIVRETVEPYQRLFDSCTAAVECPFSRTGIEQKFWALAAKLDAQPLAIALPRPKNAGEFIAILNGWRFIDSVLWGTYSEEIFDDFPTIISDLEAGSTDSIRPYAEALLEFLTSDSFGDISSESHYCVEKKPYIDTATLVANISLIPYAYARKIALLGVTFDDHCQELSISGTSENAALPVKTNVPTLFVHGELDSVTLLQHVLDRRANFRNSRVLTSLQAHSVLDDACIRAAAASFLRNGFAQQSDINCGSITVN
ncbi:MAG: alpha/beta hydrolase [Gammaproteobacteria bacterium]|nr:alpha/beta hydrolase [Gammaproteobacteria bacterium]